jgi:hypothetical protein
VLDALEDANEDESAKEAEELMKELGAEEEKKTKKKKRKAPAQTKPALRAVKPSSEEPTVQSITLAHVSPTASSTAVQSNPSSQDPVPSVTPDTAQETTVSVPVSILPTEESKQVTPSPVPKPHRQELSAAMETLVHDLAEKTQFDTLSKDELLTLQRSLQVALAEVKEVLNSR